MNWNTVIQYAKNGSPEPPKRVEKTDAEWKSELTEEEFYVTRKKGTERPHSSEMCSKFEPGIYACKCCKTELFDANEKFESGSGWPSFTAPVEENRVAYNLDTSYGMQRIEAVCHVCNAHLGHVFPDGPAPSGLRFCINALSLEKVDKQ